MAAVETGFLCFTNRGPDWGSLSNDSLTLPLFVGDDVTDAALHHRPPRVIHDKVLNSPEGFIVSLTQRTVDSPFPCGEYSSYSSVPTTLGRLDKIIFLK